MESDLKAILKVSDSGMLLEDQLRSPQSVKIMNKTYSSLKASVGSLKGDPMYSQYLNNLEDFTVAKQRSVFHKLSQDKARFMNMAIDGKIDANEIPDLLGGKADTYWNEHLQTESITSVAQSDSVNRWREFEEEADALPFLEFVTQNDGVVRPEHAELDGLTRPIGDPVWDVFNPPLGYNCRCELIQTDKETGEGKKNNADVEFAIKGVDAGLTENPAKSGRIFSVNHPYFDSSTAPIKGFNPTGRGSVSVAPPRVPKTKKQPKKVQKKLDDFEPELERSPTLSPELTKQRKSLESFLGAEVPDDMVQMTSSKMTYTKSKESYYQNGKVVIDFESGRYTKFSKGIKMVTAHEIAHGFDDRLKLISFGFNEKRKIAKILDPRYKRVRDVMEKEALKYSPLEGQRATLNGRLKSVERELWRDMEENTLKWRRGEITISEMNESRENMGKLLDSIGGLTKGAVGGGHSKAYYKQGGGAYGDKEIFAHFSENYFVGNPTFKKFFPETYKESKKLFKQLINDDRLSKE